MLAFPVKLEKDGKFIMVTFPDIPEANSQGENAEEALEMAKDALESALDFYFEDQRKIPFPSKPKRGQHVVELPVSVAAKVILLNEMVEQKMRPAELARRLHTSPQVVNRLVNLHHTTKIDGIADAMKALGKTLELRSV